MQQKILVIDVTTIDPTDSSLQGVIDEIIAKGVKIVLAMEDTKVLPEQAVQDLFSNANASMVTYAELKANKWSFDKQLTTCLMNTTHASNNSYKMAMTLNYSKCEYVDKSGLSKQLETYRDSLGPVRRQHSTPNQSFNEKRNIAISVYGGDPSSLPTSPSLKQPVIKDQSKEALDDSSSIISTQTLIQQTNDSVQAELFQVTPTQVETSKLPPYPNNTNSQHDAIQVQPEKTTPVLQQTDNQPNQNPDASISQTVNQQQIEIKKSTAQQTSSKHGQPPVPTSTPELPPFFQQGLPLFNSQQQNQTPTAYPIKSSSQSQPEIEKTTNVEQFGEFWYSILVKPNLICTALPNTTLNAAGRLRIEFKGIEYVNLKPRVECLAGIFKYHELSECLVGEFDNFAQLGSALNELGYQNKPEIKAVYQELCPHHGFDANQAWAEFALPEIINCQKLIYTMLKSFIHIDNINTLSCPTITINANGEVSITLDVSKQAQNEHMMTLNKLFEKGRLLECFEYNQSDQTETATFKSPADLEKLLNQFIQMSHLDTVRDFPKLGLCMPKMKPFYKELCDVNKLNFNDVWIKANSPTKEQSGITKNPDDEKCLVM